MLNPHLLKVHFFHSSHRWLVILLLLHQGSALVIWSIADGFSPADAEEQSFNSCVSPLLRYLKEAFLFPGLLYSSSLCVGRIPLTCAFRFWPLWVKDIRHIHIMLMSALLLWIHSALGAKLFSEFFSFLAIISEFPEAYLQMRKYSSHSFLPDTSKTQRFHLH